MRNLVKELHSDLKNHSSRGFLRLWFWFYLLLLVFFRESESVQSEYIIILCQVYLGIRFEKIDFSKCREAILKWLQNSLLLDKAAHGCTCIYNYIHVCIILVRSDFIHDYILSQSTCMKSQIKQRSSISIHMAYCHSFAEATV